MARTSAASPICAAFPWPMSVPATGISVSRPASAGLAWSRLIFGTRTIRALGWPSTSTECPTSSTIRSIFSTSILASTGPLILCSRWVSCITPPIRTAPWRIARPCHESVSSIESYCIDELCRGRQASDPLMRFIPDAERFPAQGQPNPGPEQFLGLYLDVPEPHGGRCRVCLAAKRTFAAERVLMDAWRVVSDPAVMRLRGATAFGHESVSAGISMIRTRGRCFRRGRAGMRGEPTSSLEAV